MSEDNDAVELDDDAETEAVDAAVEEEADTTEEPTADAGAEGASADAETGTADAESEAADGADATEDAGDDTVDEEDASPFDDDVMPDDDVDLLIPVEDYLSAGVHIGTQQKTKDMERFIHRVRDDGLYVLDVSLTDDRIRTAADFLGNYNPEQILVTSSRQYGRFPAEKFADAIGARARTGRFIPGTLTNPDYAGYIEPDIVVVTDPIGDAQAVKEAITVGIPVIAMCDSNNQLSNVDLVIPTNNKGRRALSVVYWLLANETLDRRNADTVFALDDFEDEL
ncbi:30S ribosomal protein S2 [Halorubrum sp. BOL3-1]|uniref:30S ribosomal protein S2 n=1 Tax=Halorubrum sp. BOL3-1 TaxID=2497325 RepID=UPI0010050F8C|nr:30S ribosomal protein S2 [Halorubrum sp. BOL3-1]QAU11425.1 30S ribosomal protein S2 [Halorubrum sp. BOL3-1]